MKRSSRLDECEQLVNFGPPVWHSEGKIPDFLDALLTIGLLVNSAVILLSSNVVDANSARYWIPGYIYLVILMARRLPVFEYTKHILSWAGAGTLDLVLALLSNQWSRVVHPRVVDDDLLRLTAALRQRGLSDGYGSYWNCHIVTVISRGEIRIRPVYGDDKGMHPYLWLSNYHDYEPTRFQGTHVFVCFPANEPTFDSADLGQFFGEPTEKFSVGRFRVEVFAKSLPAVERMHSDALGQWLREKSDPG